jgi:hypothetical protein
VKSLVFDLWNCAVKADIDKSERTDFPFLIKVRKVGGAPVRLQHSAGTIDNVLNVGIRRI